MLKLIAWQIVVLILDLISVRSPAVVTATPTELVRLLSELDYCF